jgi:hypothetical protein
MDWFRWHAGSSTDPKFRVVARRAAEVVPGARLADVLAVWAMLLERASEGEDRGRIEGFDCEAADAHLEMPDGAARAIVQAMQDKGLLSSGRVAKWEKRQPKREDLSTDRVREHRERKRQASLAMKREETRGNARVEEKRVEEKRAEETTEPSPCVRETEFAPPGPGSGPELAAWAVSLEIQQIGDGYPPERYDPGAAEAAMKDLSKRRQWPGMNRIQADLAARLACQDWTREGGRFVPKLSRYLRERMWLMKIPEAGPQAAVSLAWPESRAIDDIAARLRQKEARKHERHELPESHRGKRPGGAGAPGDPLPQVEAGHGAGPAGR